MACLSSVSFSILINGIPSNPFPAKKGLRQGDPMYPFIFSIGMEYLSRCLSELQLNLDFNYHPRCEKMGLTHLMFADDLLLFSRADAQSVSLLFQAFSKFSEASGLSANLDKSEVYFGGLLDSEQDEMRDLIGVAPGTIPFKYLGVPLSSKKLTIAQCKPLVDKVTVRINGWSARHLSYAVYLPKVNGDWNLLSLPEWNVAAISRLLWDLAHKADNLWVKWVHTYYFKDKPWWNKHALRKCSWVLSRILKCRTVIDNIGGWDAVKQVLLRSFGKGFWLSLVATEKLLDLYRSCKSSEAVLRDVLFVVACRCSSSDMNLLILVVVMPILSSPAAFCS
ncbi:uncharacterized protein LOC110686883 [Chenopodium quinoa]|uniref:uncharacterized protein LOC110686883 n=1 Tax=Chenopodium quinoa TaxID=63459 RepID=UPI000B7940E5|nr:uncharacterized protein LOC110686883 [Chenopodium quinoa]